VSEAEMGEQWKDVLRTVSTMWVVIDIIDYSDIVYN